MPGSHESFGELAELKLNVVPVQKSGIRCRINRNLSLDQFIPCGSTSVAPPLPKTRPGKINIGMLLALL